LGAVVRQVVQQEGKPNRHLYHLTERGIALLHTLLCDFPPDQAGNEAEFFTRVAFFEFLGPPEREAILNKRLVYLEGCLDYLHRLQQMANEGECAPGTGNLMSNAQRVLAFHLQRVRHEYQWIATGWKSCKPTGHDVKRPLIQEVSLNGKGNYMTEQHTLLWEPSTSAAPLPPLVDPSREKQEEQPLVSLYRNYGSYVCSGTQRCSCCKPHRAPIKQGRPSWQRGHFTTHAFLPHWQPAFASGDGTRTVPHARARRG